MIFAIIIMLMVLLVGVVIVALAATVVLMITALGIVSSSAVLGIYHRRFTSGLRALHYQICTVAALPCGIAALWLGSHLVEAHLQLHVLLVIGSIAGVGSGLLLAFCLERLAGFIHRRFARRSISGDNASAQPAVMKTRSKLL